MLLPKLLWAGNTAVYIRNRLPSNKNPYCTPYQLVHQSKPSVKNMKIFGCHVYYLVPQELRRKWDLKAKLGLFVGYYPSKSIYRIFDLESETIVESCDVKFKEIVVGYESVDPTLRLISSTQ
jgi:hypothetical protein